MTSVTKASIKLLRHRSIHSSSVISLKSFFMRLARLLCDMLDYLQDGMLLAKGLREEG